MQFGEFVEKFERAAMTKEFPEQTQAFEEAFTALEMQPKAFLVEKLIGLWNKNKLLAKPFPETMAALERLKKKKIKMAIISNTPVFSAPEVIEKFGLDKYFDLIVLSFEAGMLKQDVEMFRHCLDKLGVKAEETLMVGDSIETDMEGAEKAGIKGVLVDRRGRREYPQKISTLEGLDQYV
jgi:putative hydrolase of the HAD superfamily